MEILYFDIQCIYFILTHVLVKLAYSLCFKVEIQPNKV